MGTQLEINKDNSFRFWCTSTDSYLTKNLSQREVLQYLYKDSLLQHKLKIIEHHMTFPHTLSVKGEVGIISDNRLDAQAKFVSWHLSVIKVSALNEENSNLQNRKQIYENIVDAKYKECMDDIFHSESKDGNF